MPLLRPLLSHVSCYIGSIILALGVFALMAAAFQFNQPLIQPALQAFGPIGPALPPVGWLVLGAMYAIIGWQLFRFGQRLRQAEAPESK